MLTDRRINVILLIEKPEETQRYMEFRDIRDLRQQICEECARDRDRRHRCDDHPASALGQGGAASNRTGSQAVGSR